MEDRSHSPSENSPLLGRGNIQSTACPPPRDYNHSEGSYEELFKDSVPCPSCQGLGRVPKELENQLVALIPLKDDRLKPRRTLLYVGIAVALCAVTAGLLMFFLMPRNIVITSNNPFLQPTYAFVYNKPPGHYANFSVINHYNVSNYNFYPVKISGALITGTYGGMLNLGKGQAYKDHSLSISARSDGVLSIPVDFLITNTTRLNVDCASEWVWQHNLFISFQLTTNYSYLGHSQQATLNTYQIVSCYKPVKPTTLPPTTTKTLPIT